MPRLLGCARRRAVQPVSSSPDGRWIVYTSNESGKFEIYVQPFPGPGGKWQVSTAGGTSPAWRRDGKELFYLEPDGKLMAAPVRIGAAFESETPTPLFTSPVINDPDRHYDVSADGRHFVIVAPIGAKTSPPITLAELDHPAAPESLDNPSP